MADVNVGNPFPTVDSFTKALDYVLTDAVMVMAKGNPP